jgi:hypothetical protein
LCVPDGCVFNGSSFASLRPCSFVLSSFVNVIARLLLPLSAFVFSFFLWLLSVCRDDVGGKCLLVVLR